MMTMRVSLLLSLLLVAFPPQTHAQEPDREERAIRRLIVDAYVTAVFVTRDDQAVRHGFHPDFMLSVHDDDQVILVPLDMWLERLELDGRPSGNTVRHEFESVDVTAGTATVKLQLWIDDEHVYTDYFGLYRFSDGWKIVNKIFAAHD